MFFHYSLAYLYFSKILIKKIKQYFKFNFKNVAAVNETMNYDGEGG